jgi:hypothetical protein
MAKRSPNRSTLSWTRVRPVTRRRLLVVSSGAALLAACDTDDAPEAAESSLHRSSPDGRSSCFLRMTSASRSACLHQNAGRVV